MRKKRAGIDHREAVVRLGREVDDRVDSLVAHDALGKVAVRDVPLDEDDAILDVLEARAVAGVREQIERDDVVVGMAIEPVADEVGADEAGGSGDEHAHRR